MTDKYHSLGHNLKKDNNSYRCDICNKLWPISYFEKFMPVCISKKRTERESDEHSCLTCYFEPEWMTRTEFGDCKWKGIMPPFSAIRIERSSIFKSKPIKNCPAWRPKR